MYKGSKDLQWGDDMFAFPSNVSFAKGQYPKLLTASKR